MRTVLVFEVAYLAGQARSVGNRLEVNLARALGKIVGVGVVGALGASFAHASACFLVDHHLQIRFS